MMRKEEARGGENVWEVRELDGGSAKQRRVMDAFPAPVRGRSRYGSFVV